MYRQGRNCVNQCADCRVFRQPHRALSRKVAAVVGVSQYVLERHRALGYFEGVPFQRVIHNARAPGALGFGDGIAAKSHAGLRFGFIGRLDVIKGIDPLIDAFLAAELLLSLFFARGTLLRWPRYWMQLWLFAFTLILLSLILMPISTLWMHYDPTLHGYVNQFLSLVSEIA